MMTRTFSGIAVTNVICATFNEKLNIMGIDGYCNGTANTQYFLQIFNSATVPANASVPLRSLQVLGGDGFKFSYADIGLQTSQLGATPSTGNLVVVLSTTDATLTIGTGGVTADINVDVEEYEMQNQGTITTVGDTSTAVASLAVLADSTSNNKFLTYILATNSTGHTSYLMLFCATAPTTGAYPAYSWTVANNATLRLNFGQGLQLNTQTSSGTLDNGFYLYASSTTPSFTADTANWTILAKYKNLN